MTTILLIRHAVNDYVKTGRLAGWLPNIHLNEEGIVQASALGERLADTKIDAIYASPLERTMETAQAIQNHHPRQSIIPNHAIGEVQYGDWEGMKIANLRQRKMWQVIQEYPSRAVFPNGEALRDAQTRVINEIERLRTVHPKQTIALVSHADLIKMIVAHYSGTHLDNFQRIVISPASITTIALDHSRPYLITINDTAHITTPKQAKKRHNKKQDVE